MTIGKKLLTCFGGLLALTIAIGIYSLFIINSIGNTTAKMESITAKRQYLAGDVNTATSGMVAAERGILLRAFMHDRMTMDKYNEDRRVNAEHIKKGLAELALLAEDSQSKQMISEAQSGMEAAGGFHLEMWQASIAGKLDIAAGIYKNSLAPLINQLIVKSQKLSDAEMPIMAKDAAAAAASVSRSRWIMFCIVALSLVVGGIVVWVVSQISQSLRRVVTELSNGGAQVASASGQIASTSQSLSQGSSEQAASLEQISASTEQMTAMAKSNSQNASDAMAMMNETALQVEQSNSALREMVESMGAIKSSSEKVAKIIRTIDEIAFQTNILALNAAVEAARAGEAGMGFAVVADEVRNLAQRSAVAAKDTAGLIEEAIFNSDQGNRKLGQVSVSIRAITEGATKVKSLIEEVSESSKQQTVGINQTATAVTQVSKVTQTAAASAEESATASEQLSAQAQTMRDLVLSLSAMVNSASDTYAASMTARSRTAAPLLQRTGFTKPAAKVVAHAAVRPDGDLFNMDEVEGASFRSF